MTHSHTMRGPCAAQLEIVQPAPVPASAPDPEPEWYGDPDVANLEYELLRAGASARAREVQS